MTVTINHSKSTGFHFCDSLYRIKLNHNSHNHTGVKMKRLLIVLAVIFSVSALFAQGTDPSGNAKQDKSVAKAKSVYLCPMHPDVKSNQPGKCTKCGMNLVIREVKDGKGAASPKKDSGSAKANLTQARSLLDGAKKILAADGEYKCCTIEPCDECALGHQSCKCAEDLKAGKGVCSQCYGGWQRGDGTLEGVDPKKVKGNFHSHNHDH